MPPEAAQKRRKKCNTTTTTTLLKQCRKQLYHSRATTSSTRLQLKIYGQPSQDKVDLPENFCNIRTQKEKANRGFEPQKLRSPDRLTWAQEFILSRGETAVGVFPKKLTPPD